MSQGLVAHARTVSQRLGSAVCLDLLECIQPEIADDDRAFLSVVKTAIRHGGISVQDLSMASGYGPCVFHTILEATDQVPKMEWAPQESPRRHIFASIRTVLQHEEFLYPTA